MAVKMATAILGSIDSSLGHIKVSKGNASPNAGADTVKAMKSAAKDNVRAILSYRSMVSRVVEKTGTHLDKVLGEEKAKEGKVETVFMIQDRKNRERGLKSLQK